MRTFKFQSAGVALALIAGSAVGVQIIAVTPAAAQAQAFLITPIQTGSFDIKAGEKLTIGRLLSVHATQSNAIITQLFAGSTPGVQINGIPGNGTPSVPFPSLDALLAATVTATANGVVGFVIYARNTLIDGRETQSFGGAVLHFVEPPGAPLQAVAIAALPSPPPITNGEKVPLSKFVTIAPVYSLVQITNITFQATGGAQLNGSSGGAFIPPVLELLAAAPVTASSDGAVTIFIDSLSSAPGALFPVAYRSQGSFLVKSVASTSSAPLPTNAPTTPTTSTTPTTPTTPTTASTPTPTPSSSGAPPTGGGNRAPVAQSIQLIATTGAATPLVLKASDPDGNALTCVLVQLPSHGKLSGQAPNLSYTPDSGFLGTDALIFTATDGTASSAPATVTITVTGKAASRAVVRKAVRKAVKKAVKKR